MKKVLIITMNRFPQGDAGAIRQEIFAKLFCECGYAVDIIGMGESTKYSFKNFHEKIKYISMRCEKQTIFCRIVDRLLFAVRVKRICNKRDKYDIILVVSVPYLLLQYVKKYAKINQVDILHDSVEWYSPSEYKLKNFSLPYIINNRMNKYWINAEFKVIAISRYLQKHFSEKGCKCIRIPFINDVLEVSPVKCVNKDKIVFIYAGSIGYKDHLKNFLFAVKELNEEERKRIKIKLFGFSKEYLIKTKNADEALLKVLENCIEFYGKVPHKIIEDNLLKADFSILLRNQEERYAMAGFPTKVVESLTFATPVLCNLSSDLDLYLEDGVNSIICPSEEIKDIFESLQRILNLSMKQRSIMQQNARQCAIDNFDFRLYSDKLLELIR